MTASHRGYISGLGSAKPGQPEVQPTAQPPGLPETVSPAEMRVSDWERDQAAAELGDHFQAGRLDHDEFGERLTMALDARTRRDLTRLLADLPPGPQRAAVDGRVPHPATATPRPGQAALQPGDEGQPGEPSGFRMLPLLVPAMIVILISASAWTHHPGHGGGVWPLLLLWWVVPALVYRARRGYHRGGYGQHGQGGNG